MAGDDRGRRARGFASEGILAENAQDVWPGCSPPEHGKGGTDLLDTGIYAAEVKARNEFRPLQWLRQASKNALSNQRPLVIVRMNGQGPTDVDDWLSFLRWGDMKQTIREAQIGAIALGNGNPATDLEADKTGLGIGLGQSYELGNSLSKAASDAIFRGLGLEPRNV